MGNIRKSGQKQILFCSIIMFGLLGEVPSNAGPHVKVFDGSGPITVLGEPGYHKILSWSWGESNMQGEGGALNDFVIVLPANSLTPKFLESFCAGTEIGMVTMTTVIQPPPGRVGNTQAYQITLEDCLISSYQAGGSEGNQLPAVQFALNFSNIKFEYKELLGDGSVRFLVSRQCANPARQSP